MTANARLDGKVAIVTGGGRGIGRAHALRLAAAGAAVLVNDLGSNTEGVGSDEGPAASVVKEIEATGGTAIADTRDISDWTVVGSIVDSAVRAFGRLDIVVNNAGVGNFASIEGETEAGWNRVLGVNLNGTAALIHWAAVHWRKAGPEGGRAIVNTSSPAGTNPMANMSAYCVSKAAVTALAIAAAGELAELGARINAITPIAQTRLTEISKPFLPPSMLTEISPDHVSNLVHYLVSPLCDFTGRVFGVEGDDIYLYRGFSAETHVDNQGRPWSPEALVGALADIDRQDRGHVMTPSFCVPTASPGDAVLAKLRAFGSDRS